MNRFWEATVPDLIEVENTGWEPVLRDSSPPYMIRWRLGACVAIQQEALDIAGRARRERLAR